MDNYVDGSYRVSDVQRFSQAYQASRYQENVALGAEIALTRGITGSEWECLYNLGMRESGWNSNAQNRTSTAYGLFQFLDSTWAGTGYQKSSNPTIQIQAGLVYIENRYGTPCKAYYWQLAHNWY